jgi:hypothetical protein
MVKNSESPRISFYVKKKKNYYTCGLWTIENIAQRPGRSDLSNASLFKIPTFFFFLAFLLLFFLFFVLLLHQEMKKSEDVVAEARRVAGAGAAADPAEVAGAGRAIVSLCSSFRGLHDPEGKGDGRWCV